MVPVNYYVILSAVLFTIGTLGVLIRRNPLIIFMSIELMLNAANLAFVAFARANTTNSDAGSIGQIFVFFVITVAAAEVADLMNRVRQPFNCNNLALAAATAALDDHAFVAESYQLNRRGMEQIVAGLKRLGLDHIPSHGNFLTFKVADASGVNQRLLQQGVIVRPIAGYGLPDWLRVTIGTEADNARFLEALEKAIK